MITQKTVDEANVLCERIIKSCTHEYDEDELQYFSHAELVLVAKKSMREVKRLRNALDMYRSFRTKIENGLNVLKYENNY